MTQDKKQKKRVVVSYKNLSPELQERSKSNIPTGIRTVCCASTRDPGDFFYAIMLETEDISYLVKVDVKVDEQVEEEEEKDYYNDEIKDSDEQLIEDTADDEDE